MSKYRGQLTIAVLLIIAIAAASWAWWLNYAATQRAVQYFGSENIQRIHRAEFIEVLALSPSEATSAPVEEHAADLGVMQIDGQDYRITQSWQAGQSPGMTHLKYAILHDISYDDTIPYDDATSADDTAFDDDTASDDDTGETVANNKIAWNYCLVFGKNDATRVAISVAHGRLKLLPDGKTRSITPAIDGIEEVLLASQPE